jgi:hypothetical protein
VTVHRFEHEIAGRLYQIEVMLVGDRWRAQLRRLAGMSTALMPFYGTTPQEAAELLTRWLLLAHSCQTKQKARTAGAMPSHDLVADPSPVR